MCGKPKIIALDREAVSSVKSNWRCHTFLSSVVSFWTREVVSCRCVHQPQVFSTCLNHHRPPKNGKTNTCCTAGGSDKRALREVRILGSHACYHCWFQPLASWSLLEWFPCSNGKDATPISSICRCVDALPVGVGGCLLRFPDDNHGEAFLAIIDHHDQLLVLSIIKHSEITNLNNYYL